MPLTLSELKVISRQIDSVIVSAPRLNGEGGLYEALAAYPHTEWILLRSPVWVGDVVVAVLVRPAVE